MTNEEFQTLVLQQLQSLNEGQKSLTEGQSRIENRMNSLESKVDNIEGLMDKFESKVDKLELHIENEVIEKVRALFDDRSINQDYYASIKDSVARIEDRVEFLARQNIEHMDKLQKHDRELRLLRTEKK